MPYTISSKILNESISSKLNGAIERLDPPTETKRTAVLIAEKAYLKGATRNRSYDASVAGALFAAVRATDAPFTFRQVVEASNTTRKEAWRAYRIMTEQLHISISAPRVESYTHGYIARLNQTNRVVEAADEITAELREQGMLGGKAPEIAATNIVYVAGLITGEWRSQRTIMNLAGTVGQLKLYKEFIPHLSKKLIEAYEAFERKNRPGIPY